MRRVLLALLAFVGCSPADAMAPRGPVFEVAAPTILWSVSAGTITPAGFFTAPTGEGTYRVIASRSDNGAADTSVVTVSCAAAFTLTVSPASLAMEDGDTASLTAAVTDRCGRPVAGQTVAWSTQNAAVATVASTGALTATVTAVDSGSTSIIATVGSQSRAVPVTVTAVGAPPDSCDSDSTGLMLASNFETSGPPFPRVINGTDTWDGLWIGQVGASSWNLTKVATPQRECGHAARIELRRTDPIIAGSNRAQIMVQDAGFTNGTVAPPSGHTVGGGLGDERWFGFSVYVPSDWTFETNWAPETIFEVISGARSPFFEISIDRSNWVVITRSGHGPQNDPSWVTSATATPVTRGQWTDWVVHAVWSGSATGTLQVWKNGVQVVTRTSFATAFSDAGIYSKPCWGIYKWSWGGSTSGGASIVSVRSLYLDAIRVTDGAHGSYSVVAPR